MIRHIIPILTLSLFSAACATEQAAPRLGPDDFPKAARRAPVAVTPGPSFLEGPSAPDTAFVSPQSPEVRDAIERFRADGEAPIIKQEAQGHVVYPYGHAAPLIRCRVYRVCDIALQPGEDVLDVALGDTVNWIAQKMVSGPPGHRAPHVIVKPTSDDYDTNAIITTNRRVYHLGLIAQSEADGARYHRSVRFYYPNETVTAWKSEVLRQQAEQEEQAAATAAAEAARDRAAFDLASLHFGYTIEGDTVPWKPRRAFDDGTRVYIEMPDTMRVTESPGLWLITEHGEQALVNYRVRGRFYIVDKLFGRAKLAIGTGSKEDAVYVTRSPGSNLGSDLPAVDLSRSTRTDVTVDSGVTPEEREAYAALSVATPAP